MPVIKASPKKRIVGDTIELEKSDSAIVILDEYKHKGEKYIVTKDVKDCTIYLDSTTSHSITIKSLTNTLIVSDFPIDDEFEEVELENGSSIELKFIRHGWYIMSSDGLKTS